MKNLSTRCLFVCAAALLAATIGDAVVEGISNSGILWRGHYTDRSSVDLLPVLTLAVAALIATFILSLRHQMRATGMSMRSAILVASKSLEARDVLNLLPAIYVVQVLALFCMETIEQIVVYGRSFGGTLWLGGPTEFSLLMHALFAFACAFLLSNILGAMARTSARILRFILGFELLPMLVSAPILVSPKRAACALALLVAVRNVERGPPL